MTAPDEPITGTKPVKAAIMQPYFLPYIGYFQLIAAVDIFIVYDNIKYTKKGWINRNRILQDGKDVIFSLPLKKDSDHLDVCERELAVDFKRDKLLNQIKSAYQRAPYSSEIIPLVEQIIQYQNTNLFHFLHHSIARICEHLGITTEIRVSSSVAIDHELKSQDKVLALCNAVNANTYINAIGGMELYAKEPFQKHGIDLQFIRSEALEYPQLGNAFVPWLSIIDVMMFNSLDTVKAYVSANYELI
jgi:hypothetical protein